MLEPAREGCPPEADKLYDEAFEAFALGDNAAARAAFEEVLKRCPSHPHAAEMARLAGARGVAAPVEQRAAPPAAPSAAAPKPPPEPALRGPESPTALARGELVAVQTIHGVAQGILGCLALACNDIRIGVGLALLGAAGGAAGSFFLTLDGITPGRALAVNAGSGWGFWEGLALSFALDLFRDSRAPAIAMASGAAIGTALGTVVALEMSPTDGQVALADSGGIWAGVMAAWIMLATRASFSAQTFFFAELAATNIGLAALGTVAAFFPASRGRMFLVDAGGLLGMLLGMGAAVIITGSPSSPDQTLFGSLAAAGIVAGLGTAAFLTHGIDYPNAPLFALAPMGPGGRPGVTLALAL